MDLNEGEWLTRSEDQANPFEILDQGVYREPCGGPPVICSVSVECGEYGVADLARGWSGEIPGTAHAII